MRGPKRAGLGFLPLPVLPRSDHFSPTGTVAAISPQSKPAGHLFRPPLCRRSVVEQRQRSVKIPGLRAIQSELVYERSGHLLQIGIALKGFHSRIGWSPQKSHRRHSAGIVHDVLWIILDSILKGAQRFREIAL